MNSSFTLLFAAQMCNNFGWYALLVELPNAIKHIIGYDYVTDCQVFNRYSRPTNSLLKCFILPLLPTSEIMLNLVVNATLIILFVNCNSRFVCPLSWLNVCAFF
jgi:hypothetical protein